jgi:hypothetical protein
MRAVVKFLLAVLLSLSGVMAQDCDDLTVVLTKSNFASVKQRTKNYRLGLVFTNKDESSISISKMSLGIPLGAYFQGAKPTYRSLSRGPKSTNVFVGKNVYRDAFHSCNFANWTDITLPGHTTMRYMMDFFIDYCANDPLIFTGTIQYGSNCSKTLTPIEVRLDQCIPSIRTGNTIMRSSPRF